MPGACVHTKQRPAPGLRPVGCWHCSEAHPQAPSNHRGVCLSAHLSLHAPESSPGNLTSLPSGVRLTLPSTTGDLRASAWAYLTHITHMCVLCVHERHSSAGLTVCCKSDRLHFAVFPQHFGRYTRTYEAPWHLNSSRAGRSLQDAQQKGCTHKQLRSPTHTATADHITNTHLGPTV